MPAPLQQHHFSNQETGVARCEATCPLRGRACRIQPKLLGSELCDLPPSLPQPLTRAGRLPPFELLATAAPPRTVPSPQKLMHVAPSTRRPWRTPLLSSLALPRKPCIMPPVPAGKGWREAPALAGLFCFICILHLHHPPLEVASSLCFLHKCQVKGVWGTQDLKPKQS